MAGVLEVCRQSILLQVRGRLYIAITVLAVVFASTFLFVKGSRVRGDELFEVVAYFAGFAAFVPFVTLFLAAQTVHGDIEDRTSVYLFTSPIHRASLLLGKWLAVAVLGGVFATVGLTALYCVFAFGGHEWRQGQGPRSTGYFAMLAGGWLAALGYGAVGCLIASFFRRPMLVGVLYIMLENFASRMPVEVSIHNATVAFPIRVFLYANMQASYELQSVLKFVIDGSRAEQAVLMASNPYSALAKMVAFTIGLALLIYCRREYDSRPRE